MDKKILIIEDYPPTIEMIMACLERSYASDFALDGPTGLEKAFTYKPDLILLDIMLPGMDGIQVCRKLRADPRTAKTPIIMESAKVAAEEVIAGLHAGADEYLLKPFTLDQLMKLVKKHI